MTIDPRWILVRRVVKRIGVLRLWHEPVKDQYYISLDNRSYHNVVALSPDQLIFWRHELGAESQL